MTVDDFLKLVKSADSDKRLKGQKFSSFSDSFRYAEMRSEIIGQLMEQNILDLDDRETACLLTLKEQYAPINSVCGQVQRSLDRKTGLHLTPQKADFPLERVMTLAHSLTDPTVPDETIQRRARSGTETIILSIHDDYIEENAKFRTKAGIKCYITRTTDGKCCPWCTSIAGRYEYGKEPSDIYRRHDNCTCSVTFENGRERQYVWSKQSWSEEKEREYLRKLDEEKRKKREALKQRKELAGQKKPTVLSRQQAEWIQEQNLNRGLTNGENSGIISIDENTEKQSKYIYNRMTREERIEVIHRGQNTKNPVFSYNTKENQFPTYAQKVPKEKNIFDIISHGYEKGIEFFKQDYKEDDIRSNIDAYTLSVILKGRKDYNNFISNCKANNEEPFIRLLSCNTGNTSNTGNCFAQLLANELGIVVKAPTDILYVNPDGTFYVGDFADGSFKTFFPRK